MFENNRILLVEPHPDDVAWGCGGTVARLMKCNNRFKLVSFTTCLGDPLNQGILEENRAAMKILGVSDMQQMDFPNQKIVLHIHDIRDALYKIRQQYNPSVVFSPSPSDLHQDHKMLGECCDTIFNSSATILCYEIVRCRDFHPHCFVKLSKEQMKIKIEALAQFKTQYRRPYFKKRIIRARAILRGAEINAKYAEAFEVLRWIE